MLSFLFYVFIVVVTLQVAYYGLLFSQFSFSIKSKKSNNQPPVSVIITCKNEAKNLQNNLINFIEQNYLKFEIILVDDASTDTTFSIIEKHTRHYNFVEGIQIKATQHYTGNKKNAVTQAIKKAKYEHLLFTDADCIPNSKKWLTNMVSHFSDTKQLILGYGAYKKENTWINKLVRYETFLTAWQYFSYSKAGMPYMGVGRNMGYTKSLFNQLDGFKSHKHLQSGVDDLLVNQVGNKENTAIIWHADSHTVSQPKTNIKEWIHQKRRHITTATSYKKRHQFLLGFFYLTQLLFFILSVILLSLGGKIKWVFLLIGLRYFVYYISLIPAAKKLNEDDLIRWSPFMELFLITLQMRIFITNLFGKPDKW